MLATMMLISCSPLSCKPSITLSATGYDPLAAKVAVTNQVLWFQYPGMACEF